MLNPNKGRLIFKYQQYAQLATADIWTKNLKPDLLKILEEQNLTQELLDTSFATIKRDISRAQTNKIINRIIKLVESAEGKVDKNYRPK